MNPQLILIFIAIYFALLLGISWYINRSSTDESFFTADHKSPWYIVAFGLIGTSISGVSLISVTGEVMNTKFSYMQIVMGYAAGYIVISFVLLPLYYKLKLTSIYDYLGQRFGIKSRMTGSFYFILSRTLGAAARLYLVVLVMDYMVFEPLSISINNFIYSDIDNSIHIPFKYTFEFTVAIILILIYLYTFQSGIKTIIYTDTLQTALLLAAIVVSIYSVQSLIGKDFSVIFSEISAKNLNEITTKGTSGFFASFFSGLFICVTMTGLDQGMMQRSLSCPNLRDAQKNLLSFSVVMMLVNYLFLIIGAMLALYVFQSGISVEKTDLIFPEIAVGKFGMLSAALFMMGMIAATFSSADDAMAALTTSFCLDILHLDQTKHSTAKIRKYVHMGFAALLFIIIVIFFKGSGESVIKMVLKIGAVTYGPLLGLYAFGMFTKKKVADKFIPVVAILAPILIMIFFGILGYKNAENVSVNSLQDTWNLVFSVVGNEIIIYIAGFEFLLLWLLSIRIK